MSIMYQELYLLILSPELSTLFRSQPMQVFITQKIFIFRSTEEEQETIGVKDIETQRR